MSALPIFTYFNNRKVLFFALVIFFIPFVLFSFWNVPAADDYMILDKKQLFDFWRLQQWVYCTWSGRYFSTFVSTVFSYSGFLYRHYYLHTLLLLIATIIAWLFLLKKVNKHLLSNQLSQVSLLLASMLLLVLEVHIIPETVTAFYWFSSAITYQVPLIILLFLAGIIIELRLSNDTTKRSAAIGALLVVLLNGCNETITLFVLITSTLILAYVYSIQKKVTGLIYGLYILNLVSACFLLFAPGILNRAALHDTSPVLAIVAIALVKVIVLNWYFLKEPLWWFLVWLLSSFLSRNATLNQQFRRLFVKRSLPSLLLVYLFACLLIYFPILFVANGSLPLRSENIICFLSGILLLLLVSIFIARKTSIPAATAALFSYRYLLLSILIFCSSNMKKVTDTLLSGYFYKKVMQERLSLFEEAKLNGRNFVRFDEYALAVGKQVKKYPVLDRRVLKDIVVKTPPIICFESDLYDPKFIKKLYGIKTFIVNKE